MHPDTRGIDSQPIKMGGHWRELALDEVAEDASVDLVSVVKVREVEEKGSRYQEGSRIKASP